jgi:L-2-hydroxyglutarate oxidase LhgO
MDKVDVLIIGAGVIGLACARALAQAGREVLVVEKAAQIGTGASSRNSEVIHAGLYYEPASLKARLCVRGKSLLYQYCAARHIPHRCVGKLIVATHDEQHDKLEAIAQNARDCGVSDLQDLTAAQAQAMEPALHCTLALYSPSTGIIDSHAYMLALQGDAQASGALFAFRSEVINAQGTQVQLRDGGSNKLIDIEASLVINCAGLYSVAIARMLLGTQAELPTAHWAKGHYFSLATRAPFTHLIYPLPELGGLGVRLTLDRAGQAKLGPM